MPRLFKLLGKQDLIEVIWTYPGTREVVIASHLLGLTGKVSLVSVELFPLVCSHGVLGSSKDLIFSIFILCYSPTHYLSNTCGGSHIFEGQFW